MAKQKKKSPHIPSSSRTRCRRLELRQCNGLNFDPGRVLGTVSRPAGLRRRESVAVDNDAEVGCIQNCQRAMVRKLTVAELTFADNATSIVGGSLADGNYTLAIDTSKTRTAFGDSAMTYDRTDESCRYHGDVNGDRADALDLSAFRGTLFRSFADEYDEPFDFSADGLDFSAFRARFFNKLARPSN